ncbi:MAG: hypothetical protein ACREA0_02125 [bacterium]
MSFEATTILLAWIAIALLAFGMSGLLRQIRLLASAQALRRVIVGPALGLPAPTLDEGISWQRPTVLLFVDSDCSACSRALTEFAAIAGSEVDLDLMAVFRGSANGNRALGVNVLEDRGQAFADFRIPLTPFAVAVTGMGTIADASGVGSEGLLREFVGRAQRRSRHDDD